MPPSLQLLPYHSARMKSCSDRILSTTCFDYTHMIVGKDLSLHKRRSWLVLSLGFGGLLACILGAALGTLLVLERVRTEETRARRVFIERLGALDQIRGQIYL